MRRLLFPPLTALVAVLLLWRMPLPATGQYIFHGFTSSTTLQTFGLTSIGISTDPSNGYFVGSVYTAPATGSGAATIYVYCSGSGSASGVGIYTWTTSTWDSQPLISSPNTTSVTCPGTAGWVSASITGVSFVASTQYIFMVANVNSTLYYNSSGTGCYYSPNSYSGTMPATGQIGTDCGEAVSYSIYVTYP
jgi:hypothetical protein